MVLLVLFVVALFLFVNFFVVVVFSVVMQFAFDCSCKFS